MLEEIADLGFEYVELSHGLKVSMLPGIMEAVDRGVIKVAGVHNYFPAPIDEMGDTPDGKPFTSDRPEIRRYAIDLTKKSMERGAALGARYIVLHMGTVESIDSKKAHDELRKVVSAGKIGTREYADLKGKWIRKRQNKAEMYFARCQAALNQLLPLAKDLGMVLGVEGRSHFDQVPNEYEAIRLMDEFKDEPLVRYWHDFGHIQRKHNLLMAHHEEFIASVASSIGGAHINDVKWPLRDHQIPFYGGDVDFDCLLKYFPTGIPYVWELSSQCKDTDIKLALAKWKEKFPFTLK